MTSTRAHAPAGRAFGSRATVLAPRSVATPRMPRLRGIDSYAGHTMHTARWNQDYDLAGKRVAVIGTGPSAIERIPELVGTARSVEVFQRTPAWVLPRLDYRPPAWADAWIRRHSRARARVRPAPDDRRGAAASGDVDRGMLEAGLELAVRSHLRLAVRDPWLRRQLTPDFRAGCKRLVFSSDYYPALQAENCQLIPWPIATPVPSAAYVLVPSVPQWRYAYRCGDGMIWYPEDSVHLIRQAPGETDWGPAVNRAAALLAGEPKRKAA